MSHPPRIREVVTRGTVLRFRLYASLKTWLYAGNSENPALLAARAAVTMRPVRTISREVAARLTPQRLYAGLRQLAKKR
jgi:hypothetical protein